MFVDSPVTWAYSKPVPGSAPSPSRWKSNHSVVSSRSRPASASEPEESWPPVYQTIFTGVPLAAMPRAFASASVSGKSVSASPWMSSVGAVIRSRTDAGLDRSSRAAVSGESRPVVAASAYAAHTSGRNRPQTGFVTPSGNSPAVAPAPSWAARIAAGSSALPEAKNSPAQSCLNTPSGDDGLPAAGVTATGAPTELGKNAFTMLFHVICGTIASTRSS